jgi:hypothetical protein
MHIYSVYADNGESIDKFHAERYMVVATEKHGAEVETIRLWEKDNSPCELTIIATLLNRSDNGIVIRVSEDIMAITADDLVKV